MNTFWTIALIIGIIIFVWISYELCHAWHIDKHGNLQPPPQKFKQPPGIGHSVHPDKPISYNAWCRHIHRQVHRPHKRNTNNSQK